MEAIRFNLNGRERRLETDGEPLASRCVEGKSGVRRRRGNADHWSRACDPNAVQESQSDACRKTQRETFAPSRSLNRGRLERDKVLPRSCHSCCWVLAENGEIQSASALEWNVSARPYRRTIEERLGVAQVMSGQLLQFSAH